MALLREADHRFEVGAQRLAVPLFPEDVVAAVAQQHERGMVAIEEGGETSEPLERKLSGYAGVDDAPSNPPLQLFGVAFAALRPRAVGQRVAEREDDGLFGERFGRNLGGAEMFEPDRPCEEEKDENKEGADPAHVRLR